MQEQKSDVARMRELIELEYQAAYNALYAPAMVAKYDFISRRMRRIDELREELTEVVGHQEAMKVIIEVNDQFADYQGATILTPEEFAQLAIGDIIYYHLDPSERPINPRQEWKGRIKKIVLETGWTMVEILTEGYEGEEPVFRSRIVRVAKASF